MRHLRAWLARMTGLFGDDRRDADLAAEIQSHLQLHVDDGVRAGLSPEEARRQALVKFGGVEAIKEAHRERRRPQVLSLFAADFWHGCRMLRRAPLFTLTAASTLALGVGANAAMFGVVDALMFQPPAHVREPERIVGLSGVRNYLRYLDVVDRTQTLDVAAYTGVTLSLGRRSEARPVRVECVTASFFPLLGTPAHLGRVFGNADEKNGSRRIMLSHHLWREHFGASGDVIGRTVDVAARSFDVIGIAPAGFRGIGLEPVDAWLLLTPTPELCSFTGTNLLWSDGSWLSALGRVRPGISVDAAGAELATFTRAEGLLPSGERRASYGVSTLDDLRGIGVAANRRLARWLAGGALAVLLIACANVAGLLGIRALERRREIAVRLQVGGSRLRVFTQLLTEHLVLAALCCGVAWTVAVALDRTLAAFFPFAPDGGFLTTRALALLAVFAVVSAIASGLVPAIQAARANESGEWRSGAARHQPRSRIRQALLAAQVALTLTLVMSAGLFVRSLGQLERGIGFELDRVISVSVDLQKTSRATPRDARETFDRFSAAVGRLPDVESTALSTSGLAGAAAGASIVTFLRASLEPQSGAADIWSQSVSPGYFATVGTPLVAGREFTRDDHRAAEPVAIIDEALARRLWPEGQAVGRCAFQSMRCLTIVGVSAARRARVTSRSAELFRPLSDDASAETTPRVLLIRTRGHASDSLPAIAAAVRRSAGDLPYVDVQTLASLADDRTRSWRLGATVFLLFGTAALVLTAIGLYASLAFATRQQMAEIGLRMTLGATPAGVLTMVLRRGLIVVGAGWAIGTVTTWLAIDLIRSQLFEVSPTDPRAFGVASLVVIVAGLAGTIVPAARAARVDPAIALRND